MTMQEKIIIIFLLFFLLCAQPLSAHQKTNISLQRTIWYVDGNNTQGPWQGTFEHPFQSIQTAVFHAQAFDTIFIKKGVYYEDVVVDHPLNIQGEHQQQTIIDGQDQGTLFSICAEGVTLSNVTLRNSGGYTYDAGIHWNRDHGVIANCTFYQLKTGIISFSTAHMNIENITCCYNGIGVWLRNKAETSIHKGLLYNNAIGVYLEHCTNITMESSQLHTNGIACFIEDSHKITMNKNVIFDNSDNHGGILIRDTQDITITTTMFSHNGMGINAINSNIITVDYCDFLTNTHFAAYCSNSTQITFKKCTIKDNKRYGLYFIDKSTGTISQCNLQNNLLQAITVQSSTIQANRNYWGSILGPWLVKNPWTSYISSTPLGIHTIPWKIKRYDSIGSSQPKPEPQTPLIILSERYIEFHDPDPDYDHVPTWWELKYGYDPQTWDNHLSLDPDKDGLSNIEECYTDQWGSNPFFKDIFVEIDWMSSQKQEVTNKPDNDLLQELKIFFSDQYINLHIDVGDLGGGEQIPTKDNISFADLQHLYWDHFLHKDPNNLRKGIFHYGIICDYGPDVNFPFVGWDHFDSFLVSASWLEDIFPQFTREQLIVGACVHQLGSTLGLLVDTHEGNDNLEAAKPYTIPFLQNKNYKSCMNYFYKYKLLSYSDGTHGKGDFDDWSHLNLTFFKNSIFQN